MYIKVGLHEAVGALYQRCSHHPHPKGPQVYADYLPPTERADRAVPDWLHECISGDLQVIGHQYLRYAAWVCLLRDRGRMSKRKSEASLDDTTLRAGGASGACRIDTIGASGDTNRHVAKWTRQMRDRTIIKGGALLAGHLDHATRLAVLHASALLEFHLIETPRTNNKD